MRKNSFFVCVGGNHFKIEGQTKVILIEKQLNSKSCRNQNSCNNMEQKYKTDVVLAAIFCFAYLKVNDTKDRMLTDIFEFSTPKLCTNKRKK